MFKLLTKTDFLIAKDCNKNAWLKVHLTDIYKTKPLSGFDLNIIETGNKIDVLARDLFPGGVLVEDKTDTIHTNELIEKRTPVIYQPVFATDTYLAVVDIIVWNETTKMYDLHEVKSSTATREGEGGRKKQEYIMDLAFQKIVLDELAFPVGSLNLIRLNKEYVRDGELSIHELFNIEKLTDEVEALIPEIKTQMAGVYEYLLREDEPKGHCDCWTKSKNNHCTTFWYSNPDMPKYSVHQISRIGTNIPRLTELVESNILDIHDVPSDFKLTDNQRKQVDIAQSGRIDTDEDGIKTFLDRLEYPLAFIDYETYPSAIPRFDGYYPYNQIPFQFSLHVINEPGGEVLHSDFIHTDETKPDEAFASAMQEQLPDSGSILVWSQKFEKGINKQIAERLPKYERFIEGVQNRIIDLIEPFDGKKAVYWHPEFYGKSSIKFVLPALVPELSYSDLEVQEGGAAADTWNRVVLGEYTETERKSKVEALREYCTRDTKAMVEILKKLMENI